MIEPAHILRPTDPAAARKIGPERVESLLKITAAIAEAVTREDVLQAVVHQVAEALGASSAGLWLMDENAGSARLATSRGYSDAARAQIETLVLDRTPSLPVTDSLRLRRPIWLASKGSLLQQYPHLRSVVSSGRFYRVACLPLVAGSRLLGTLGLTIEEEREAPEEEREFLLLVARYASQAVERLRLLETADAAANRLRILAHASRAFAESETDLDERLERIGTELANALDGCINLALLRSDGMLHLTVVQHPIPEANEELRRLTPRAPIRLGEGVTGAIAATGKSVILPVIDAEMLATKAPPTYRAFLERFPAYALIGAPLRARGRVIGTVTAAQFRKGQSYTDEDLRLLEELAERAAIAIENSRLFRETSEARTRVEHLYLFAQTVVRAERVDEVFAAALDAMKGAYGANRSAVLLFDSEGVMCFRAWRGLSDQYRQAVEGHSPWAQDATICKPVLVTDALNDPSLTTYSALFKEEGIGALAFIPLVAAGRLLGKFMLYYEQPRTFPEDEVQSATALATYLASVTLRFSLIDQLRDTIRFNETIAGILAHDLRNPLGAISTSAQILLRQQEGQGDKVSKPITRILSSSERMARMIEQLLDFTRARVGGGIELKRKEANLAQLCAQVVDELELVHSDLRIEQAVNGDLSGRWDPDRLLQVLSNILGNARQHGRVGGTVRVLLDGADSDWVSVEVRNEGAVPESILPYIFEPFRTSQAQRQSKGLGLGLYITKELVEAHGGTVDVDSSLGTGTAVAVRLPRNEG